LIGFEREEVIANVGSAGGGWGSDARKASRAWLPPTMERMWVSLSGDGANKTMQFVVRGGHLCAWRCSLVRCFAAAKGYMYWEGTMSSNLVVEIISIPSRY